MRSDNDGSTPGMIACSHSPYGMWSCCQSDDGLGMLMGAANTFRSLLSLGEGGCQAGDAVDAPLGEGGDERGADDRAVGIAEDLGHLLGGGDADPDACRDRVGTRRTGLSEPGDQG